MATRSSVLAWKNSMDRGAWQGTVCGVATESATAEHIHTHTSLLGPEFPLSGDKEVLLSPDAGRVPFLLSRRQREGPMSLLHCLFLK